MKWTVGILLIVGVVAAIAAAVLVVAVRADNLRRMGVDIGPSANVTVVVAKKDIPAMSIIDAASIEVKTVARDKAPEHALGDQIQAVGKVLAVPLIPGQALTTNDLAPDGTGMQLAAQLPTGMRAVAVTVSDAGGLHGILYPGCVVDILVAIHRTAGGDEAPQTISTTLLENIPVLAVDQQTIVTPASDKKSETELPNAGARNGNLKVTVRVDTKQAKVLQLGQDVGTLSLALRSPLDKEKATDTDPVTLRILAGGADPLAKWEPGPTLSVGTPDKHMDTVAAARPEWQTTVIRGDVMEARTFALPASSHLEAHDK